MRKSNWLLLVLALVLSMFLVACSGGEDTDDTTSDDTNTSDEGNSEENAGDGEQVFNFLNGDTIPSMDPNMVTDTYGIEFTTHTMEGLYRLGEDSLPVEGIAIDHEVSDDATVWTFNLREDAEWSNGDPVTAHDFVYSWRRAVDPDTGSEYGPYMMGGVLENATEINAGEMAIEELGVEADGDYTLVVTLEKPVPYFESLTTFPTYFPLNEEFTEEQGDDFATSTDTLLFNGPFTLENWDSVASEWEIVKNENYWDAETVQLDKITYQVMKEIQPQIDLYEQGEVDRAGISSDFVDEYSTHEDYQITPEMSVFYMKFNQTRNEALDNVNIRKAISKGYNKNALVDTILNNGSIVATGLMPADFAPHPETGETFRELNGDLVEFDAEEAQQLWEKGLEELGEESVEIEYLTDDSETAKNQSEYIKNQLETNLPGLTVTLKQVPFEQRLDLDTAMDYDIQAAGWGPDYLDPNTFLDLWVTDGPNNYMGYSNPEYDALIEEAANELALEPVERYNAFLEAEQMLFEDAAIAPTYQRARAQLIAPKVQGVQTNPFGSDYEYKWAYAAE
ncbi:peptide ABC transporter substrate-binding protein [Aquibacillus sediminis]|uniref:peptide ABC transporter substrate-binding protein n=1 Tax=Aquibacillus sediminis TaxID=2574734 RepID=UPI00110A07E3|nr:peptide ABC transporter substrate-binding protein [Aquibacillus sediminis]